MDDRVWLAALRASGTISVPHESTTAESRGAAAARAGRGLVLVDTGDDTRWAMTWSEDIAPQPEESGGAAAPSHNPVVVLAACVRACWPDPAEPFYPGVATTIDHITEVTAELGVGQARRAINALSTWGYLIIVADRGELRLGPRTALWSAGDIATLGSEYDLLPHKGSPHE